MPLLLVLLLLELLLLVLGLLVLSVLLHLVLLRQLLLRLQFARWIPFTLHRMCTWSPTVQSAWLTAEAQTQAGLNGLRQFCLLGERTLLRVTRGLQVSDLHIRKHIALILLLHCTAAALANYSS
ncbi:hypothetical protein [Bosea sp. (in: a-proteobacteria)]|uniref:hypothetical protein n=1 Tax=Bosea sp. (in: a-proteobacteria) TaxID=1871050 RepID=UPI004034A7AE